MTRLRRNARPFLFLLVQNKYRIIFPVLFFCPSILFDLMIRIDPNFNILQDVELFGIGSKSQ